MSITPTVCLVPLLAMSLLGQDTSVAPQLISVQKIWNEGQHNAFTDLIRFKDAWFCAFRESEAHVGGDGRIRVLMSRDGEQWGLVGTLGEQGVDLRDPKLSIAPGNRLMLVMGGSIYEGKTLRGKRSRVAFSTDGKQWSAPQRVLEEDDWLWRVTWHNGRAYGIAYTVPTKKTGAAASGEWTAKFVTSVDGVDYKTAKHLDVPGRPNEATVRFMTNGDCVTLLRREGLDAKAERLAWIGTSRAPYEEWKWRPAELFVGGPNFILLPNGEMIASGRENKPAPEGPKTFVGRMDQSSVTPQLILPSAGDSSYPGLVWHEGVLWVSYYSSHEGKSSIYLAKVKVP